jgi:hypothetical protein
MLIKIKHLRHHLGAAQAARMRYDTYLLKRRFVKESEQHFRGDTRYDLEGVRKGFMSRASEWSDDTRLLERICDAYIKADLARNMAPKTFEATAWWSIKRETGLLAVMHALGTRDIPALNAIYRNFFRDRCSRGLVEAPPRTPIMRSRALNSLSSRQYLCDLLHRIDYWRAQTGDHFNVSALAIPEIGNPFGADFNGSLVTKGAPYHHYCALRVENELSPGRRRVVEIGGGFGGMAYFLIRSRPKITYVDFDVPESIALTTYYLGKAFPELRFLLYGEKELTNESLSTADVVLMPAFEMEKLPRGSIDVTISSHAISDMSTEAMRVYLELIGRFTQGDFLYTGNAEGTATMAQILDRWDYGFRLMKQRSSEWRKHTHPTFHELECHYSVGKRKSEA